MNRRSFVKSATCTAALIPFLGFLKTAPTAAKQKPKFETFTYVPPLVREYEVKSVVGTAEPLRLNLKNGYGIIAKHILVNKRNGACCRIRNKIGKNSFSIESIGMQDFEAKRRDKLLILAPIFKEV